MKPICIIPARGGSKGVPSKNIRLLGGKPLIAHTIESTLHSKIFSHVIVTTDSKKIAEISQNFGAEVPFMRPKELATDIATTPDVLLHAIEELYAKGYEFDTVVMRDCTCPFIDKADIQGSLDLFSSSDCDTVYAGIRAHPNPYFGMGEVNSDGYLVIPKKTQREINRRQDAPMVFDLDGLIVFDAKNFLNNKVLFTAKSLVFEISKEHGHMIDFEFDFIVAELLYEYKTRNKTL